MAKHEAKEAHIELDEYEAELRRKGRFQRKQAEEADKWSQIAQGIAANNCIKLLIYSICRASAVLALRVITSHLYRFALSVRRFTRSLRQRTATVS